MMGEDVLSRKYVAERLIEIVKILVEGSNGRLRFEKFSLYDTVTGQEKKKPLPFYVSSPGSESYDTFNSEVLEDSAVISSVNKDAYTRAKRLLEQERERAMKTELVVNPQK